MKSMPLFTRDELAAAFRLILSPVEAERRASTWFELFGEGCVDHEGRVVLVATPHADDESSTDDGWPAEAPAEHTRRTSTSGTGGFERFRGRSEEEKGEYLMHFSDFHLNLVSLVSPEVAERVRVARGDTPEQAAWRIAQMRKIVEVMRH
jgi:hypothetical protein